MPYPRTDVMFPQRTIVEYIGELIDQGSVLLIPGRYYEVWDANFCNVGIIPLDKDIKLRIQSHHNHSYAVPRAQIRKCTDNLIISEKQIGVGDLVNYIGKDGLSNVLWTDQIYRIEDLYSPSGRSYAISTTEVKHPSRLATRSYYVNHNYLVKIPNKDYIVEEVVI